MDKYVYIWAHHGLPIGNYKYEDFSNLPDKFEKLLKNRKKQNKRCVFSNNPPCDDLLKNQRNEKFKQYALLEIGNGNNTDVFSLMNDEVFFKHYTGSVYFFRFESFEEALNYYIFVCDNSGICDARKHINYNIDDAPYYIGCTFELLHDFGDYHKGDILQIYDTGSPYTGLKKSGYNWICPRFIEGKTMILVPGTKWSKIWLGYEEIPAEYCKIIKKLGKIKKVHEKGESEKLF